MSKIYQRMMKQLLQGVKAKFFLKGVTEENLYCHEIFRRAKKLGIQTVKGKDKPEIGTITPISVIRTVEID